MDYNILLYYLYTPINEPEAYAACQRAFCQENGLKGRVLIAKEGINGTLSGTREACASYMEMMRSKGETKDIEFKVDETREHVFPRLSIKVREEIVTLGLGDENFSPLETTGKYLEPPQWKNMMGREDVVVLDARNDYESEMGRFEGALCPDVASFKELPAWIIRHKEELEGKKILAYCTGGVRCEKFTGYLMRQGFDEVYHLHGGIVNYGKHPETQGEGFEGRCYVFDERVGTEVNRTPQASIVSSCLYCEAPTARQINCAWPTCNGRYFCCEDCESKHKYCSVRCEKAEVLSLVAV